MGEGTQEILSEIIESTDNNIVMFIVAVAVALFLVFIPFYLMVLKDRKERRAADTQRKKDESNAQLEHDRVIIQVVTANTEAITSLKSTLENNSRDYYASLDRIHTRIDDLAHVSTDIQHDVRQILSTVDKEEA